jgi:DNA-3-methyladenine glycosylase
MKLGISFYQRDDVVQVARDLLGKVLVSQVNGVLTSGMIVETEAYSWKERGCHAYQGRQTPRNAAMFLPGGHAYIYLCYGLHHMVNVVTNRGGVAEAVLIRALEPWQGLEEMRLRRNMPKAAISELASGPGKLAAALGIDRSLNGEPLTGNRLWITSGKEISPEEVAASPRIGIAYAQEDAKLPWRFYIRGHACVSKT